MPAKANLHKSEFLYWAIVIAVFLAAVAAIFYENEVFYQEFLGYFSFSSPTPALFHPARVTIDFGNGKKRAFEGRVESGMTIFSALRASQDAGGFEIITDNRGRVVAVNGVKNVREKQWGLYMNGVSITTLPGNIEIQPGDRIVFRYE